MPVELTIASVLGDLRIPCSIKIRCTINATSSRRFAIDIVKLWFTSQLFSFQNAVFCAAECRSLQLNLFVLSSSNLFYSAQPYATWVRIKLIYNLIHAQQRTDELALSHDSHQHCFFNKSNKMRRHIIMPCSLASARCSLNELGIVLSFS